MRLLPHSFVLAAATLVLDAPGLAQGVVLYREAGDVGNVVVVDPEGLAPTRRPAALQGIRLLPIEVNGRTRLERFLPGRTRRMDDIPGASRLLLPGGQGSLYRFERPEAGGSVFGFLVVDAAGDSRAVLERPGTGVGGDVDPFVGRVAVAPAGDAFLAGTHAAAGGDLLEVDLATGTTTERTAAIAPVTFLAGGLALHDTWGVAVGDLGVWRFDRAGAGDVEAVPFDGGQPPWLDGDVVLSPNGLYAATIAGAGPTQACVWSFAPTGAATCASGAPAELSGGGFLPDAPDGPYLAISDDGTHCAWRRQDPVSREAFLDTSAGTGPLQVTADASFVDTLDEIGQFLFIPFSNRFVLAVGEGAGTVGQLLERVDYYEVTVSAAGEPTFVNLTATSGDAELPFDPGTLAPLDAFLHPSGDRVLIHSDLSGGTGELLLFEPGGSGLATVLSDVKDLDFAELVGGDLFVGLRTQFGNSHELWRLPAPWTGAPQPLLSVSDLETFDRAAARPDGWLGVVRTTPTSEFVHLFDASSGQVSQLTTRPLLYGPNLSFSPAGDLVFSVGQSPAPSVFARWTPNGPVARLPVPSRPGFVLPGA